MLKDSYAGTGSHPDLPVIKELLDQFEKILDAQQENVLKRQIEYINSTQQFSDAEKVNIDKLNELGKQLDSYMKELEKYD